MIIVFKKNLFIQELSALFSPQHPLQSSFPHLQAQQQQFCFVFSHFPFPHLQVHSPPSSLHPHLQQSQQLHFFSTQQQLFSPSHVSQLHAQQHLPFFF